MAGPKAWVYHYPLRFPARGAFVSGVAMRSQSFRLKPIHALLAFALLALVALAVTAAEPVAGNAPIPEAGAVAPQFTLVDQNGKTHKLADYKGKWVVVYFYP